ARFPAVFLFHLTGHDASVVPENYRGVRRPDAASRGLVTYSSHRREADVALVKGVTRRLKDLARPWLAVRGAQSEFQRNLRDWEQGGPLPTGWTRTGPPVQTPACRLKGMSLQQLDAGECFAKNRAEAERWHVAFLKTY